MVAALGNDEHVAAQRELYRGRRDLLLAALTAAGFTIDDSRAGLYLWVTAGEDAIATVSRLAELGILVAPGSFYGEEHAHHVRIALTATDAAIDGAVARLSAAPSATGV
jgi:aspartate/methionine/tyrosine aminotransferase